MEDIEREVFTRIATRLREAFPDVTVSSIEVYQPAHFPHVSITEDNNSVARNHLDSSDEPKFAELTYRVGIYTNAQRTRRQDGKRIQKLIDTLFYQMNFVGESSEVPNRDESSIYRRVGRYRAVTDGNHIYRR